MRILIADDAPQLRLLLRHVLVGHEVVEAGSGDEALGVVGAAPVDVAILDVNMPGRTGLEVCRPSAWTRATRPPASSSSRRTATRTASVAREAGADAFLTKPFSPRRLCELVDALAAGAAPRPSA